MSNTASRGDDEAKSIYRVAGAAFAYPVEPFPHANDGAEDMLAVNMGDMGENVGGRIYFQRTFNCERRYGEKVLTMISTITKSQERARYK